MADQTTEVLLGGIRADTRTLLTEARERGRADQQKAVETMRQAAQEQMSRIDKRISELQARRGLEPALWGAACGVLLACALLLLGVWMGDRGVSISWLLTFGWHL
jgi:Flp pilus assembly protein TadB